MVVHGHGSKCRLPLPLAATAAAVLSVFLSFTETLHASPNPVKTAVYLSPKFELKPGSVTNKFYYDIDFPKGHIAIKSFDAEVVTESGESVPLHETYLHHWLLDRYYQRQGIKNIKNSNRTDDRRHRRRHGFQKSDYIPAGNSGVCKRTLTQYFGLGSETRRTSTRVPDPYGIVVGNPFEVPNGYEEKWLLNVHAIDTRGVEDKLGCTECRCDLYNVTEDEYGRSIDRDYIGGLRCCYDQTRCRIGDGLRMQEIKRGLYLKYTVKYVDWEPSILPVKIYIFDVTDTWKSSFGTASSGHDCLIEYQVDFCGSSVEKDGHDRDCTDIKRLSVMSPDSGDVVYGVAHQHTGGIGSTLYGEDGRVICSSIPIYGEGNEAGNEAGYIVGMSTCYPKPGTMKISQGEILTLVSNYSSTHQHTGVMGLFYILVANSTEQYYSPVEPCKYVINKVFHPNSAWGGGLVVAGVAALVAIILVVVRQRKNHRERESYEPIMAA